MPSNLHAFLRYQIIDECFRNKGKRKWTKTELCKVIGNQLHLKTHCRNKPVSCRTLEGDIQVMRSNELGFNAPIEVSNGFYFYSNPHYTIAGALIPENIKQNLRELLHILEDLVSNDELYATNLDQLYVSILALKTLVGEKDVEAEEKNVWYSFAPQALRRESEQHFNEIKRRKSVLSWFLPKKKTKNDLFSEE
jgi:hypothetical protein